MKTIGAAHSKCCCCTLWKGQRGDHIIFLQRSLTLATCLSYSELHCWLTKHEMVWGKNTFLICCYVMNHPELSGHWEQVYFLSPGGKWNMENQLLFSLPHISGTNSEKPGDLFQASVLLRQAWRSCLRLPYLIRFHPSIKQHWQMCYIALQLKSTYHIKPPLWPVYNFIFFFLKLNLHSVSAKFLPLKSLL